MTPPATPLRFSPMVEKIEDDEDNIHAQLVEQLLKISRITYADGHKALRSVHAKSHGILKGKLTVVDGLPPVLAQGLFAVPGEYSATLRFSTSPGDLLPDSVSTPRGLAIKLDGVTGELLPGAQAGTQDFLLVTGKAFLASDAKHFLSSLKLLASTTDKVEKLKVVLSAVLRGVERTLETVGGESGTVKGLGGYPETHILGESFFSQAPLRYGDYIAKVGVFPVSPEFAALTDAPLDLNHDPEALRHATQAFFATKGGMWDLRVQLCTNLKDMPVEDASKLWDEAKSPYVNVARLEVPAQESWSNELRRSVDDGMAFSPWNGLAAHQPLGSIMRARKQTYLSSSHFRFEKNGCPFTG